MDALVTIHSLLRWVVLLALFGGATYALLQTPRDTAFRDRPFSVVAILFDLQVALGLVIYVLNEGWDQNTFMAMIHPAVMLVALAVVHIALGRARKAPEPRGAYRTVGSALLFSLLLVVLAIPWNRGLA